MRLTRTIVNTGSDMAPRRNPGVRVYKLKDKTRSQPWRVYAVDLSGKTRTKHFARKVDAERHADQIRTEMRRGRDYDPAAGEVLFSEVWESYLRGRAADLKPKTLAGYESLGASLILPTFGDRRINSILPSEVAAWVSDLQMEKGKSKSHSRSALVHFRAAMQTAVRDRLIFESPAEYVEGPGRGPRREGKSLTADQLFMVADAMPTRTDRVLTLTLGLAGLRFGEASGLQIRAVDLDRGLLKIRRTYSEVRGKIEAGVPKNHQTRTVPVPASLADELRPLLKDKLPTADVFTRGRGGVLRSTNWLPRVYRPALKRAGISDPDERVVHDLRHTYASLAVQAGANIKVLTRVMGHADADETLNTYADLYPEDYAGLGEALEAAAYSVRTDRAAEDDGTAPSSGLKAV